MATPIVKNKNTKTYVFLHLNTTDLPYGNCRITEICMMAINRKSFKETLEYDEYCRPLLPRVVNKLVVCIKPEDDITDEAKEQSKLTNERLSQQKSFREYTSSLITSFLDHLRKPVCLIAHYGNGFDFRVLKEELERIHAFNNDFANMRCADSLDALRALDPLAKGSKKRKIDEATKSNLKRSRTEPEQPRKTATPSSLKKAYSLPIEQLTRAQCRSFGVREYFEEMFKRKPDDTHTAEGYCKALVNIVHNTPGFFDWVDRNNKEMMDI